jgi:hypothetical protein
MHLSTSWLFLLFRSEISASAGLLAADILDLGLSGGRNNSEFLAVPLAVSAEKSRRTRGFGSECSDPFRRFTLAEQTKARIKVSFTPAKASGHGTHGSRPSPENENRRIPLNQACESEH